jgi:hypothetical protein
MPYLYLIRTVQTPVRAVGCTIVNVHGDKIAKTQTTWLASAMAEMINASIPIIAARDAAYEAKEVALRIRLPRPEKV